ncbi:glycosyltransferase family 2 protein [Falsarthrobacter nasiphocae]|uniref:Glycosyltransferase involved in cell wall biosynthesis n=1 Tax=Falsarthrobacter nasiphocae TaxID=189863 RepID=A0AAE3YDY1_9MICC|nr:glycosyltransferase family 2 protein [Falsarthrobacter nasiphocae]MDR6891405.1 glycosyltransferase involved in cell wall biosynthesis [Falsarthrobacter nasiphocae]
MTIDVMFPYYGDVAMMKAAVDSVLAQTHRDFVLTIVDDGYPDETLPAYFEDLVARDDRVVYHRNEKNLGANGNYRKCVGLVKHDVVVIMGADDIMLPNYLETIARGFESFDVDIIQPGIEVIDEKGSVYLPLVDRIKAGMRRALVGGASQAVLEGEPLAANLVDGNWLYFPSVAWKAEAITRHNFREGYDVVQDLALALDVIMDGGRLLATDTVCFQYRRHRESDSSVRALDGRRFVEERRFFDEKVTEFRALGWNAAARAAKLHVTSRLNAASLVPKVVSKRMWPGLAALARHAVRP